MLDWPADDEPMATRHFSVPEYRRAREEEATATMNALVSKTLHDGYRVETRFAHGKPYREILGVAAKENSDLVVLGVQGRNTLDLMLFGSTTNQVVRRAACPVLTLRQ